MVQEDGRMSATQVSREVIFLGEGDLPRLDRFMLLQPTLGHGAIIDDLYKTYFIQSKNGLGIAVTANGELESVMFSAFEKNVAVTRSFHGAVTPAVTELFDTLCASAASRSPRPTSFSFLFPVAKWESLRSCFECCRLKRLATTLIEHKLLKHQRPSDHRIWADVLSKNIPNEDMTLVELSID